MLVYIVLEYDEYSERITRCFKSEENAIKFRNKKNKNSQHLFYTIKELEVED